VLTPLMPRSAAVFLEECGYECRVWRVNPERKFTLVMIAERRVRIDDWSSC